MSDASTGGSTGAVPRRLGQVPGLDGMRGFAVLLVVAFHLMSAVGRRGLRGGWGDVVRTFDGGWLGVDMFFVLSGFLITALLLDEQAISNRIRFGAFYIRRALRLLPALYFMLAGFTLFCFIRGRHLAELPASLFAAVTYSTNLFDVFRPRSIAPPVGHLWSLAIEEQFYLVWPPLLALAFGLRRRAYWVVPSMVGLIALVAILRARASYGGMYWGFIYARTDFRVDGLLIGALLAQLWVRGLTPRRGLRPLAWVGIIGIAVMWWNADFKAPFWYRGGLTLFAVCTAFVLLGVVDGARGPCGAFSHPALRFLGRYSYALYLWHFPVFYVVRRMTIEEPIAVRMFCELAVTATAVALSWWLVERPALRLKRRWEVRGVAPLPVDGTADREVSGHVPAAST